MDHSSCVATKFFQDAGWWEYVDPSGRQFYYSPSTAVLCWTLPEELRTEWWEMRVEGQTRPFFFRLENSTTDWER